MGPELSSTSNKSSVCRLIQIIVVYVSRDLHFLNYIIAIDNNTHLDLCEMQMLKQLVLLYNVKMEIQHSFS